MSETVPVPERPSAGRTWIGSASAAAADARAAVLAPLAALSAIFVALFAAYRVFADRIHAMSPATDPLVVNAWLRRWVTPNDGAELYVMFAAVCACFGAGYIAARGRRWPAWAGHWMTAVVCVLPALAIVAGIRTTDIAPLPSIGANLRVAFLAADVVAVGYILSRRRAGDPARLVIAAFGALSVAYIVVVSTSPPDLYDYGFFIGPARKLAAGERLGSFYMQYNLLGTYLFRGMVAARLRAHEMQAVLSVAFVAWMALYYLLARRLVADGFLRFAFVAALFVVRFVAIDGGPARIPQVSTIRLDLWVPLMLVLLRWGPESTVTGVAFCLTYLADNVFGFLYLAFYGVARLALLWEHRRRAEPIPVVETLAFGAGACAVAAFQWGTFHSFTNPAASLYQNVHIGMLPIDPRSLFWGVMLVLLLALYPIVRDPDARRRRATLFLYAIAAAQLTYFFGRSHDHNLLNLSGIFVLVLFAALDGLRRCALPGWVAHVAAGAFIVLASVAAAKPAADKFEVLHFRAREGLLIQPNIVDRQLAAAPQLFEVHQPGKPIFLASPIDAYLNYRYGLPQTGYFAPFYANVYADSTALLVRGRLQEGYDVLTYWLMPQDVAAWNASPALQRTRDQFALVRLSNGLGRLILVSRGK